MSSSSFESLMATIGHRFRDESLLRQALTHTSVAHGRGLSKRAGKRPPSPPSIEPKLSNERLEFLGDRVLGLVVADMLFREFPDEPEGALAKRHAQLVRRETLAEVARDIGLGAHIIADMGEEAAPEESDSVLSDGCEAVIGAIYLDAGLAAARRFVETRWLAFAKAERKPPQDAKTELQEWAQGRGLPLPIYKEVGREGPPHAPYFSVEVSVEGEISARGEGRSKRAAEQAAAEALLQGLGDPT
jgi:ribonuclease-3